VAETKLAYERSYLARLNYVHQKAVKHSLMTKALRCSPAMAAGVSNALWSVEDIVALLD
jgi:hypothetical protein